ncbi:MAG TPA: thioredoxin family protein [Planctomycetota bacterium]|nr:thioredoxin family protein [Planctomycetota bacterium]
MTRFLAALTAGMSLLALPAFVAAQDGAAQEPEWHQDFAAAKAKAKAGKLDLLMDFTGSDWCMWCKRLDGEVFSQDEFKAAIGKSFVLVKLDYPRDQSLVTPEVKKQNEQLKDDFGIEGYPTVYLADAEGRPYAKIGYEQGGAKPYLEHLARLQETRATRDAAFAKAKGLKSVERAKALADALTAMDEDLVLVHYQAEMKEILGVDTDGKAGLKERFQGMLDRDEAKKIVGAVESRFQELAQAGQWDEVATAMDKFVADHKGKKQVEQMATFYKAISLIEGKKDYDGALKLMDAVRTIDPESEIGKNIDRIKDNVQKKRAAEKGDGKKDEGKQDDGKKGDGKKGGK